MSLTPRKASESLTIMTELVIPNDTNVLGDLRGGKLLHWMDICSAIAAAKHANNVVTTAAVDSVSFNHPIGLGNIVTIRAQVTRAYRTSMEVFIEVWAEQIPKKDKIKSNEAYYTFVAIDDKFQPVEVPPIIAETELEKKLFDGAPKRRKLRLILSGKVEPGEHEDLGAFL